MTKLAPIIREIVALAGAGLFCYGLYSIYKPTCFMVAGALLVWFALPTRNEK